jgi:hypothetical protein
MNGPAKIPEEKARAKAEAYLKERHFKFEKIVFQGCEQVQSSDLPIYRFNGLLIEKPASLLDMLARDRKNTTCKFVIDVNADNGRVITYHLT